MEQLDSLVGKTIGDYDVVSELGRGGMGVVYKAHEKSLQRVVALKILPQHLSQDKSFVDRFMLEARAAARLSHPNIVHVYSVGEFHGMHYIAMEYVKGQSVSELLAQKGVLDLRWALSITGQVASCLAEAHRLGIVHRDIKPQNIMINRSARVKVMDFGLAKITIGRNDLTSDGTKLGTPLYMPPEQIEGDDVDGRADIYALGVTLFEMLVGRPPITGESPLAIMYKIVNEPFPDIREWIPDLPEPMVKLIAKMTAKSLDDRFASAQDVYNAIKTLLKAGVGGAVSGAAAAGIVPSPSGTTPVGGVYPDAGSTPTSPAPDFSSPVGASSGTHGVTAIDLTGQEFGYLDADLTKEITGRRTPKPVKRTKTFPWRKVIMIVLALVGAGAGAAYFLVPKTPVFNAGDLKIIGGIEFVYVPGGTFEMGAGSEEDAGNTRCERPKHRVTLTPFWMSRCEVTNAQFREFVNATGHKTVAEEKGSAGSAGDGGQCQETPGLTWRSPGWECREDHPVVAVTWKDADAFLEWFSGKAAMTVRLPTEAEWEYACRTGKSTMEYMWGVTPSSGDGYYNGYDQTAKTALRWSSVTAPDWSDGYVYVAPVGSFRTNDWNLCDMIGNVQEMLQDYFDEEYYARSLDATDPPGPPPVSRRCIRGGGWNQGTYRSTQRAWNWQDSPNNTQGFRLVAKERSADKTGS